MKTDKKASLPQRDISHNPLAIIHEIDRLANEKIKTFAPPIPRSCQMIMMHLARKDNVTQLDLVHATRLKAPTVSICLQKMESDGLVIRHADEHDMRATRVLLTEKGRNIDRSVISKVREHEMHISDCLTTEERDILVSLLKKIRENLLEENNNREE
jgi:DNA-binding MarR family transcriptional regulator